MIKAHIIAQVVNDLRDTAIKFHGAPQLRERLRGCIEPLLATPVSDSEIPNNCGHSLVQAQEPVGYVNLRYGTFFPPRTLAHTERNTKLLASGEIIRVYSAPAQPVAVPDGWSDNGAREAIDAAIAAKAAS